jgi:thiamine transporter ThiT
MRINGPKQIVMNTIFFTVFMSLPIAGLFRLDVQRFLGAVMANPLVSGVIGLTVVFLVLFVSGGDRDGHYHGG